MAGKKDTKEISLVFNSDMTAYEAASNLKRVNTWVSKVKKGSKVVIDGSAINNIDTAGCQIIDMAITAAQQKNADVACHFSEPVKKSFEVLGLENSCV